MENQGKATFEQLQACFEIKERKLIQKKNKIYIYRCPPGLDFKALLQKENFKEE